MKIVFFAPLGASFGEALQGVRLATELCRAGHEAVFLAPAGLEPALRGSGLRFGRIDAALTGGGGGAALVRAVHEVVRAERADALLLVDLAAVAQACAGLDMDFGRLVALGPGAQVLALDAWDLAAAGPRFDLGPESISLDEEVQQIDPRRRLVPVPFARPDAIGAYRALPEIAPLHPLERDLVRADLGLSQGERLVLLCTARWQHEESQDHPERRRRCLAVPALCEQHLGRLDARVRVLHIGPAPLRAPCLGGRYRHVAQVAQAAFAQLLAAADLLLGWNAAATSLGTAIAARLPVLLLRNSLCGASVEEVARAAPFALSAGVRDLLSERADGLLPLAPLHAAPLRLCAPLHASLQDNPLYEADGPLCQAEMLDEAQVLRSAHALLFCAEEAAARREAQARYQALLGRLPGGVARLLSSMASF